MSVLLAAAAVLVPAVRAKTAAWTLPKFDYGELDQQIRTAIERAKPACVAIVASRNGSPRGAFSGVIASAEGHILTAAHCIRPRARYEVLLADGRKLKAIALGRSPHLDCGLLKIADDAPFPWAQRGVSSKLIRNQPCLSISHPGGFNPRRGLVIRFGRVVGTNRRGHIHNTCLMEPGDSGGGLFDIDGRVIGIHSYINRSLADNFDIPVDCFRDNWTAMCAGRDFNPPSAAARFGIGLRSNRATEEGAEVTAVVTDSPAAKAGVQVGDRITRVNQTDVTDRFPVGRALQRLMFTKASQVKLTVRRKEETLTLTLTRIPAKIYTVVSEDRSHKYAAIAKLDEGFAAAEAQLDDCTVRVTSKLGSRQRSLLGTVLNADGLIATKSSRVGDAPTVTDAAGRTLPATIVGRDEDNDIVLLHVAEHFERFVGPATATKLVEGQLLVSPRPGKRQGLLSILGSQPFRSPRRNQIGFLGVTLDLRDGRVVLSGVTGRPAKEAGLKPADAVVKIGQQPIASVNQMIATIRSHKPGEEVRITIKRGATEQTVRVVLGSRPANTERHIAEMFAGGKSVRRTGFDEVFCHDAHVHPDECGGPLFDAAGDFMGINIARFSRTRCYALPPDLVWKSVARIRRQAPEATATKLNATPVNKSRNKP